MPRPSEFSNRTKLEAWQRCMVAGKPHCEVSGCLILGRPEYDHRIPLALGGESTLENCVVSCTKCHRAKTSTEDIPRIAKAKRIERKRAGITRKYKWPSRPMRREAQ